MSEHQYFEFMSIDRAVTAEVWAKVAALKEKYSRLGGLWRRVKYAKLD